MVDVGADYAGLEEFGAEAVNKPKARSMKKLKASDGATAMDQLKNILSVNFGRVIELFRDWDDDGSQTISMKEFRRALPVLGVLVERADADNLFREFDEDGSGEIDYNELAKKLRVGADVELDAALQAGAMGEIKLDRDNAIGLRKGLNDNASKVFGTSLDIDEESEVPIVQQLSNALGAPGVLARVIDIFRAWDEDGSGTVSKKEFVQALPMLGLKVSKEQANELFDTFDEDGSGSIDYAEIHKKLRKQNATKRGPLKLPRLNRNGSSTSVSQSGIKYTAVREALAGELEAKRSVTIMKRRLAKLEREEIREANLQRRAAAGAAIRKDIDQRVGRDLNARISQVPTASQEEMVQLAEQLANSLEVTRVPSWFLLFREMDEDGSGRISYAELKSMVRKSLRLSTRELPDLKLQSVWRALDEDASGFISTGEFGRFMKLAGPPAKAAARVLGAPSDARMAEEKKTEDDPTFSHKLLAAGGSKADDAEMTQLSAAFNLHLNRLPPDSREWFTLFKQMDADGSGKVSYDEFERVIRTTLAMKALAVPDDKLQRLWLRLDEDLNGHIDAGEFGRFMRRHRMKIREEEREEAKRLREEKGVAVVDFSHAERLQQARILADAALPAGAAAGMVVAHKKSWKPTLKPKFDDIDPAEEEHLDLEAERTRASRAMTRLQEEARQLEQQLQVKRDARKADAEGSGGAGGVKLPSIGRGTKSAPASSNKGGGKKASRAARAPPSQVLRAYGLKPEDGARVRVS